MKLQSKRPRTLTRYAELKSYLQQFAEGKYPSLWIDGRTGVGKSQMMHAAMRGRKYLLFARGRLSALGFYSEVYEHLNEPIILDDDIEPLLEDDQGRNILLALGERASPKSLHWTTKHARLGDTPDTFETTSALCIIANNPPRHEAIRSRIRVIHFEPTNFEVHNYAAEWFWDQEIYDWIGRHLSRLCPLDLRYYSDASDDRIAGRDWADLLRRECALDPVSSLVQDLEHDPACPTRCDKERRFLEIMAGQKGASRANYFAQRKKLKAAKQLDPEPYQSIAVRCKRPPAPATNEEVTTPPADLPARDSFARPITGATHSSEGRAAQPRIILDDTLPNEWSTAGNEDAADEDEQSRV